jgi:hypothetical protein
MAMSITHLDGADVVVIDARGWVVPEVDEVRLEPGRAWISVRYEKAHAWCSSLRELAPEEPLACAICAIDGHLHWSGPVSLACV